MTGLIRHSFRYGSRGPHRDHRRAFFGTLLVFSLAIGTFAGPVAVANAASPCVSSGPASGAYTVSVCISAPADGATVSGDQTVTAIVTVTGTNPGIAKTLFNMRGAYLLTDYANPYTFTLSTTDFVDGPALVEVEADMRDGFASTHASINLTFNNGITTPPVNTKTWSPKTPAPLPGRGGLVVAAAGDGADGSPNEANVTSMINGWNPDMFLYLGDVYEKGTLTEFKNVYGDGSHFYGQFKDKTNPVVGNHEYENNTAPGYFNYWDNAPHYYSYNDAGWHFIALDSSSQFNQVAPGTPQYNWLQNDLASNTQPCTLAYFHHPVYSVGPNGDTPRMNQIWSLFNTYSVDIVLAGHDHDYQRWLPIDSNGNPSPYGVTQFVVGTGGHGVQPFVRTDGRMVTGIQTSPQGFGALKLTLGAGTANYLFQSTSLGVFDTGTISCSPSNNDTQSPTAPSNLSASALGSNRVDLSWAASTDNVGVVSYDITRNGSFLCSVPGGSTSYSDTTAAPSTTYSYTATARDLAGNSSPPSNQASATTGAGSGLPVFSDGFESGNLAGWTNTGMVRQQQEVFTGSWAARATTTSAAAWAWQSIPSETNAYYRLRFKIVSLGANNVYLMKVRTATGTSIGGLYVDASNTLNYRNDAGAVTVRSPRTVSLGAWHELQVHYVINDLSGQIETWLDGTKVNELSKTDNFGTTPVGRLQIADNSGARAYDVAIDDVVVDTQFIAGSSQDTTPPSVPANVNAAANSTSQITIAWNPSTDNTAVAGYNLYRDGEPLNTALVTSTSYTDTGLDAGVTYSYTVQAQDAAGNLSAVSTPAVATTPGSGATAPDAPTGLTATGSSGQVGLSWTAPAANGGAAISGYKVYRSTSSGTEALYKTLGNVTSYSDTGVTNGTTYYYKVTAVNAVGESTTSNEDSATPAASVTVPGAPGSIAAARGNTQVTVSWSAPISDGGSPITGYTVYRRIGTTGSFSFLATTSGSVTTYTDTNLTNGTAYWYQVSATNIVGEGPQSTPATATPAAVPGSPTGLAATGSPGQVALSWTAPTDSGGSPITGYKIFRTTTAGSYGPTPIATVTGTSYTNTGLTNGTTYYYIVKATNSIGDSPASNEASATPNVVVSKPSAPTSVTATPGNGQVVVNWAAPASNGGGAISSYTVYRSLSSSSGYAVVGTTTGSATSFTNTGLTNGTTYFYEVSASNSAGEGPLSSFASATPATTPGAPTGLTATASAGQVALSWTAPSTNGGSAVTGYQIWRSTTAGAETLLASPAGTQTTYTNTGLTNGTTYFYTVKAVNLIGASGASNEASATPVSVPGAPRSVSAKTAATKGVTLTWAAPTSNGGSAITGYKIYKGTSKGAEILLASVNGTTLTYTDTVTTSGTRYYYYVTAINSIGESPKSSEVNARAK